MSLRFISNAALALALTTAPFQVQVARAQNPAPAPPPTAPDNGPDDDRPGPPPARGNDDNGPRNGGGDFGGGPREGGGGPRGGGRRGGALGAAFMGFDEVRANETPLQRQQRVLQPYLAMLPTLSAEQQTHIMAILDAASAEMRASVADTTISEDRRNAATRYVRSDIGNRVAFALTEDQLAPFNAYRAQQSQMGRGGEGGGGFGGEDGGGASQEDPALVRARVLAGYEDVMDELSVKQKTDILAILKAADAESATVRANAQTTPADKTAALRKIHDDVNTKVLPLLEADQVADWKKAHAAKRP